ncbi:hypothetical protein ACPEIF_21650 [Streptomyces sp. NPDC012600]|uniref:hypothetical protein n=1 Tax=Streptomyces sp. NPDC012600 TaxID=3415005 RepID=UPI003C2F6510
MITEPELVGESGPDRAADEMGGFDRKPTSGRRRGSGLLWGAAGALLASAVWASAVFVYGIGGDRKPETHGYQLGERSCSALRLKALIASVGERIEPPELSSEPIGHPALDSVACSVSLSSSATTSTGWSSGLTVWMTAELHKETDPRAEFEARAGAKSLLGNEPERSEAVPGLGDQAYLLVLDERDAELRVLEGGAVITLAISLDMNHAGSDDGEPSSDPPEFPGAEEYHADLISDMRDLMKQLKTA